MLRPPLLPLKKKLTAAPFLRKPNTVVTPARWWLLRAYYESSEFAADLLHLPSHRGIMQGTLPPYGHPQPDDPVQGAPDVLGRRMEPTSERVRRTTGNRWRGTGNNIATVIVRRPFSKSIMRQIEIERC